MNKLTRPLSAALALLLFVTAAPFGSAAAEKLRVAVPHADVLASPSPAAEAVGEIYEGMLFTAEAEKNGFYKITLPETGVTGWARTDAFGAGTPGGPAGVSAIYVKTPPDRLFYTEDESVFDSAGLSVWAKFDDGRPDAPVTGWTLFVPPLDAPGEKTVTVRLGSGETAKTAVFTVTVGKIPLRSLTVASAPYRTAYIERQTPDWDGLALTAAYTDGRAERTFTAEEIFGDPDFTVTRGDGLAPDAPLPTGELTVRFVYKYEDVACALTLTARERRVTELRISKPPDSLTVYTTDETPTLAGMELTAVYDNGETETVLPRDCTVFCDPSRFVLGDGNPVTLYYGGRTVSLTLTYAQEFQTGISLQTPEVLAFIMGEEIDLSGLKVWRIYASGAKEETEDYVLSPVDPLMRGAQTLTVTSGEFSAAFTIFIQEYYRRGDVTGDGDVTAADARLILRAAVGYIEYKGKLFQSADADRDGHISAADARLALRAAVGLETLL